MRNTCLVLLMLLSTASVSMADEVPVAAEARGEREADYWLSVSAPAGNPLEVVRQWRFHDEIDEERCVEARLIDVRGELQDGFLAGGLVNTQGLVVLMASLAIEVPVLSGFFLGAGGVLMLYGSYAFDNAVDATRAVQYLRSRSSDPEGEELEGGCRRWIPVIHGLVNRCPGGHLREGQYWALKSAVRAVGVPCAGE